MEDMERYGDYNEVDESPSKNPVVTGLKILVAVVCFAVIGFIGFRLVLFNYYPSTMSKLYFDGVLTEYYNETSGSIGAKTQDIRFPYDDPNKGNFFCDNLFVIDGAGQIQVSVRFNDAIYETFKQEYGVEISDDTDCFKYTLVRDPITKEGEPILVAEVSEVVEDSLLMYRYKKLVFNGVDLGLDEGEDKVEWLRLEIELIGAKKTTVFRIPIYENNSSFAEFSEHKLSPEEKPQ